MECKKRKQADTSKTLGGLESENQINIDEKRGLEDTLRLRL